MTEGRKQKRIELNSTGAILRCLSLANLLFYNLKIAYTYGGENPKIKRSNMFRDKIGTRIKYM